MLVEATFRSPSGGSLKAAATRGRGLLKAYHIRFLGLKNASKAVFPEGGIQNYVILKLSVIKDDGGKID